MTPQIFPVCGIAIANAAARFFAPLLQIIYESLLKIFYSFINLYTLGRSTGVISTAYVTHATPASAYAHTPSRKWTSDADLTEEAKENGCKDIASQLIEKGRKINVGPFYNFTEAFLRFIALKVDCVRSLSMNISPRAHAGRKFSRDESKIREKFAIVVRSSLVIKIPRDNFVCKSLAVISTIQTFIHKNI